MWSNSKPSKLAAAVLAAALVAPGAGAMAGSGEVEITDDRKSACAKAETRFKKVYPDYKVEPGVALVKMYKYNFCPANLTVEAGTKVRWINIDKRTSHSVWLKEAGIEESERFFPEELWEYTFTESGPYPYLCGPHWKEEGMVGFVKVVK